MNSIQSSMNEHNEPSVIDQLKGHILQLHNTYIKPHLDNLNNVFNLYTSQTSQPSEPSKPLNTNRWIKETDQNGGKKHNKKSHKKHNKTNKKSHKK